MNLSTAHTKEVTIPLLLVVAGIVLTGLAPNSETLEKFLLSYLKNKSLVLGVKALVGAIVCLLPYYVLQRVKKISPKTLEKLLSFTEENCDSKYNLRANEVYKQFNSIIGGYASSGFPSLPGMANRDVSELYLNELRAFSEILTESILEVLNSEKNKLPRRKQRGIGGV